MARKVVTNRKGDVKVSSRHKKHPSIPRPVPTALLSQRFGSAYPFMEGVPSVSRPVPIQVTQSMQMKESGKNKAQVVPSNKKPPMSKKKIGAIVGGTIGGAFGAVGLSGIAKEKYQAYKQRGIDAAFDDELRQNYEMMTKIEDAKALTGGNWKGALRDYYEQAPAGGGLLKDIQKDGLVGGVKDTLETVAHPPPSMEAEEFFDAVTDIE